MTDIAKEAEEVIKSLREKDKNGNLKLALKTNQIRKFLTAVNAISNKVEVYKIKNLQEKDLQLSEDLASEIAFLKVKAAYQAGRNKAVKVFINRAKIMERIEQIGRSVKKYEDFARYIEALVAYHKFYGGEDR